VDPDSESGLASGTVLAGLLVYPALMASDVLLYKYVEAKRSGGTLLHSLIERRDGIVHRTCRWARISCSIWSWRASWPAPSTTNTSVLCSSRPSPSSVRAHAETHIHTYNAYLHAYMHACIGVHRHLIG
jgi:hypothetical protein